jgi:hypothetical protein
LKNVLDVDVSETHIPILAILEDNISMLQAEK